MPEYRKPSWATRTLMNLIPALAARAGLSLAGAWLLTVRGRKTGKAHTIPVNPLTANGAGYLVSPRGETQWARNLRAAGEAELQLGRRKERVRTVELADAEKPALIGAYLERWGNVTRSHFGTTKEPDDAELARLAARTPVFRVIA